MSTPYILVLGASGLTGTEVTRQLSHLPANIRVTYREQADLNQLRNFGAEPFYADYEAPETLRKAMKNIDRLIVILPIHEKFETWGRLVIDCTKEAKIKQYTVLSNFAVGQGGSAEIAYHHEQLERYAIDQGIPYTILRSATYFQNILWSTLTIMRQNRISLPLENAKLPYIDMRDVAEALVKATLGSNKQKNKIYTLTGSKALSMFDIARLLSEALGKTIRYYPTPLKSAPEAFRDVGMIEWIAQSVAAMYSDYATLDLSAVSSDFTDICGKPPRAFTDFIQENIDLLSGK